MRDILDINGSSNVLLSRVCSLSERDTMHPLKKIRSPLQRFRKISVIFGFLSPHDPIQPSIFTPLKVSLKNQTDKLKDLKTTLNNRRKILGKKSKWCVAPSLGGGV